MSITQEQMLTDGDAFVDSGGYTPWGAPIEILDTRCKGDCGLINKRCIDCGHLVINRVGPACGLGYWTMNKDEGPMVLRRKNKKAESCLEFKYTLTE